MVGHFPQLTRDIANIADLAFQTEEAKLTPKLEYTQDQNTKLYTVKISNVKNVRFAKSHVTTTGDKTSKRDWRTSKMRKDGQYEYENKDIQINLHHYETCSQHDPPKTCKAFRFLGKTCVNGLCEFWYETNSVEDSMKDGQWVGMFLNFEVQAYNDSVFEISTPMFVWPETYPRKENCSHQECRGPLV